MLIANGIWSDEWFCSLEQRLKLLYLYLLGNCSKCGIFELNMRKINFDLSNGTESLKPYTAKEVLGFAGNRIRQINESKAIIVKYIQYNWIRDKPLNPVSNPLHRGLANELAKYGLTFDDLNEMAGQESVQYESDNNPEGAGIESQEPAEPKHSKPTVSATECDKMFDAFWQAYPRCIRKIDKKKCKAKLTAILKKSDDAVSMFRTIMDGLEAWKQCSMWNNDDGKYICAPLVWLNGDRWDDRPEPIQGIAVSSLQAKPTEAEAERIRKLKNIVEVGICK